MRLTRSVLLLLPVMILAGCQPQNVRPDAAGAGDNNSGNAIELQQRAYQAYQQGDWQAAEKAYVALTRQVPQEAEPWFRLGNVYAHLEQPGQAVAAYQEALVRDPGHGKAWHNMGIVQLRQAMNSFLHLQNATEAGDPLNARAQTMLDTVTRILEQDFESTVDETVR